MKKKVYILIAASIIATIVQGCGTEKTATDVGAKTQMEEVTEEAVINVQETENKDILESVSEDEVQNTDEATQEEAVSENAVPAEYQEAIDGI